MTATVEPDTRPSWHIVLPYLSPPLSANDRPHWAKRARIVAQIRSDVGWLLKAAKIPPQDRIAVELHYRPKDRQRRDGENLAPTLKPAIDATVDAGIVPDDTAQYVDAAMPRIHPAEPGRPPSMWLEIQAR